MTLEAAAEQALGALEAAGYGDSYAAIDLREALAQPQDNLNCKSVQARLATLWGYVKAQPQGEWVDLTDGEIKEAFESRTHILKAWEPVHAIIAKFKEKNAPPVVPQGEPVAWIITEEGADSYVLTPHYSEVERALKCPQYKPKITPLYTTPPSVEAAIEETKIAEQNESWEAVERVAAAIREMK